LKKLVVVCLCACMLFIAGCFEKSDYKYVEEKGTIVIGITEYAPMHIVMGNGEWIGFDADFAKLVAQKLNLSVEFKVINWDEKVSKLNSKDIDCIWNGYTINDEDQVSFSTPYAINSQILVMLSDDNSYDNEKGISDMVLAVEKGSSAERLVTKQNAIPKTYKTQKECLNAVISGDVSGCVVDKIIFDTLVHTDLKKVKTLNIEEFGIGFRKGSDLKEKFDSIIKEMLEDGSLLKLAKQYEIELV